MEPTGLAEIIGKLNSQITALPALGGHDELALPNADEREAAIVDSGITTIDTFAEPANAKNLYREVPSIEKSIFRFFIDGSERTYFVETGLEQGRSFPIEAAQVGAVVLEREGTDLSIFRHEQKNLILIPHGANGLSDEVWGLIEGIQVPGWTLHDYNIENVHKKETDLRDRARGKALYIMHELEVGLIRSTDDWRDDDTWLLLDGSVRFGVDDSAKIVRDSYVIGLAKSFSKHPQFKFSSGSKRKDITAVIAGLEDGHRTVAFFFPEGRVAFWFLRLQSQRRVDHALMGVVKIEIAVENPGQELDPETIDRISASLLKEKSPSSYGLDQRWPCQIYPITAAEKVIKGRFMTREVINQMIKRGCHA